MDTSLPVHCPTVMLLFLASNLAEGGTYAGDPTVKRV